MEETPNHELNQFEQGDTDWEHSSDMATIEERLTIRDEEANLENYEPHEAATFIATDTGAVFDGDGTEWVSASRGYDEIEASSADVESLSAEQAGIDVLESRSNVLLETDAQEQFRQQGFALSTFDDLSEWSVESGDVSLSAETDDPYAGTQSAELSISSSDDAVIGYDLPEPVDLQNVSSFSVALKTTDHHGHLRLRLIDTDQDGDPVNQYGLPLTDAHPHGSWYRGDAHTIDYENHNNANVTRVEISRESLDSATEITLDDLRVVPDRRDKAGIVLWAEGATGSDDDYTFNNGEDPFYKVADQYSVQIAVNTRPGEVEDNDGLDLMLDAQRRGHEIVPRPELDGTSINFGEGEVTEEEARKALERPKRWFIDNGLTSGVHHVVALQNDIGSEAQSVLGDYAVFARSGGFSSVHGWRVTAPHNLNSQVIDDDTVSTAESAIDEAVEHGWVANIYWHNGSVSEDDMRSVFSYIQEHVQRGDLEVLLPSDLWDIQHESTGSLSGDTLEWDGQGDINDALEEAGSGGTIFVPPGDYGRVEPLPDQTIHCSPAATFTSNDAVLAPNSNDATGVTVTGGTWESTGSYVIFDNRGDNEFESMTIVDSGGGNEAVRLAEPSKIHKSVVEGSDSVGIRVDGDGSRVINCDVDPCPSDEIRVNGDNCHVNLCTVDGDIVDNGSNNSIPANGDGNIIL